MAPLPPGRPSRLRAMVMAWPVLALVIVLGALFAGVFHRLLDGTWDRAFRLEPFLIYAGFLVAGQLLVRALANRADRRAAAGP